jgi:hypothetical protein
MTKAQLMNAVLDQLLEQMSESPESFELLEPPASINLSVVWKPKVKVSVNSSSLIDPSNTGSCVIVTYNTHLETMTCFIGKSVLMAASAPAEAQIEVKKWWLKFSSEYKKYNKLIDAVRDQAKHKEAMKFLNKLMDIFPGTLDEHLLGKRDE